MIARSRSIEKEVLHSGVDKKKKSWRTLSFWRKRARFLFRILLAVGFITQSYIFIELYLQYPATVELEVVQPFELEMPAFTVCNINE